jgi:hypothetical protein
MNPTFYKTIVRSKHWQEWVKYQEQKIKFDVHESMEMDWLSPEHFEAFIKYIQDKAINETSWGREFREAMKKQK